MAAQCDVKISITLEDEIQKNPGFPINHISILKEWATSQPHLPPVTEEKLFLFHASCMCNLDKTKACMETYYSIRSTTPEFFNNRDLSSRRLQDTIENVTCFALTKKTAEGYVVLYQKVESSDVTKYNFDESCKLFFMTMDALLRSEGSVPGIIFLLDYTNIRFGHLAKARIASIRTMFKYVQEGVPVRLKAIHMVNMNYFIEKVMTFVKPFMNNELHELGEAMRTPQFISRTNSKLVKGIHSYSPLKEEEIHYYQEGSLTNLYNFIPKDCLPLDYGGNLPACKDLKAEYVENLMEMQDFFSTDERFFRCNELLRQSLKKPKRSQSLRLSFKTLEID